MQAVSFEETIELILKRDPRFAPDAYVFVREALDHTQKKLGKTTAGHHHHITGQQLLEGIRSYALDQFGPMALTVLIEWGIRSCPDFGAIVFNMVDHKLLAKTDTDSLDDFKDGYDFDQTFRQPFLPTRPHRPLPAQPKSTQV